MNPTPHGEEETPTPKQDPNWWPTSKEQRKTPPGGTESGEATQSTYAPGWYEHPQGTGYSALRRDEIDRALRPS